MISGITGQTPNAFDPTRLMGQGSISMPAMPNPIGIPTLSQRLIEAEGYLDNAFKELDDLQGMDKANAPSTMQSTVSTGSLEVAARVCEKAAILGSRIKTIAGQVGAL